MEVHNILVAFTQGISLHQNMTIEHDDVLPTPHVSDQHISTKVSFALSFVTLVFAVTGTATNAVSVFLYTRPTMRSSMNVLLAGLSAFDLAFSILSIPTFVVPPMCVYKPEEWIFLCSVTTYSTLYIYPLTNVAKTGGVWTLVYITVQRWLTVRRPFRRARGSSLVLAKRALFAIFVASIIYNSPRFFEHQPLEDEHAKDYIRVREHLRQYPLYMSVYYSILYLLTHFVIPFTVLAFINGSMICAIRRALKQHRVLSHSEKAAAMMATVVFVFVFCNTLPFVLNFVEFIDRDLWIRHETKMGLWAINDITNILLLVSATSNAFIYYYCNHKYAQVLKRYVTETYQLAKDRFNYPGGHRPVSRYRMVTSNGVRRPVGPRRHYRRPESSPCPPPYAVYTSRPARACCYLSPEHGQPTIAPFDIDPKCILVAPDRSANRKRSRSVLALAWRTTGRLRSGMGLGRSLSSTALTMVGNPAAVRSSFAGLLLNNETTNGYAVGAPGRRGLRNGSASMRSII